MPIAIKMPALSPTMEEGKLARWLVKVGDTVSSGDIMAEIETDKATMEFEAVDEGTVLSIDVAEGTEGVKVGTVIAQLGEEGETAAPAGAPAAAQAPAPAAAEPAPSAPAEAAPAPSGVLISPKAKKLAEEYGLDINAIKGTGPGGRIVNADVEAAKGSAPKVAPAAAAAPAAAPVANNGARVIASPLAKRIAAERGVNLASVKGSGPNGRIVRADVENAPVGAVAPASAAPAAAAVPTVDMAAETRTLLDDRIPHSVEKLSGMRKTIARRLWLSR